MEHVKILGSPCPLGLCVHPPQEIGITLRIEHDHHIAAPDVLGDKNFSKPCLADARSTQHQCVSNTLTDIHPDVLLVGFDRVQGGLTADGWQR